QVAQQAEGGMKGFAKQVGGLALVAAPYVAALSVVAVGMYRWKEQLGDNANMKEFANGLGLTHKEMKKLGDVSVTTGDIVRGVMKTIKDGLGEEVSGKRILDYFYAPDDLQQLQTFFAQVYGLFAGAYNVVVELWGQIAPVVSGYVKGAVAAVTAYFQPVVDAATWAANGVGKMFRQVYDWAASWLTSIGGAVAPVLKAMGLDTASAAIGGAGTKLGAVFGKGYAQGVEQFVARTDGIVNAVGKNTIDAAQDRLTKKANELKADRTPEKPKTDKHAEQLARDAAAIEAQIRNLYALADAYGVSGAEALIAEARVKAESQAIKQRGDIEAAVARQVRLSIAQRVSDAAKSTATMRDQAAMQEQVNAAVAAGTVPAERANELLRDRIADLPLLAAIEAAYRVKDLSGAQAAEQALDNQRAARDRLTDAETKGRLQADLAKGRDQLAVLEEELRLVSATDAVRNHTLAVLKATQEAETQGFLGTDGADWVAQQVAIADGQQAVTAAQAAYNELLDDTVNRWSAIGDVAGKAASGMTEAFGKVGTAIGDVLTGLVSYGA
ncbi:hypothetical protein ACFSGX_17645, partial [Sphingomonas arantia]